MIKGEWSWPVEDLGDALFGPVEVEASDLENAGILHVDPEILVGFEVSRYEVTEAGIDAHVWLVFQFVSLEPRELRTRIEIEGCPREAAPFLRLVGNYIADTYEKAREHLRAPGPVTPEG